MSEKVSIPANQFFYESSGIVTLCGSTRFFFEYMEANRLLTFLGWIVLQCGSYGHSFHKYAKEEVRDYSLVKKLHFEKIHMSHAIVVCTDSSGYQGDSTLAEIEFANFLGIPVYYFVNGHLTGESVARFTIPKRGNDTVDYFLSTYKGKTGIEKISLHSSKTNQEQE